jgi:hypothetical protein
LRITAIASFVTTLGATGAIHIIQHTIRLEKLQSLIAGRSTAYHV